MELFTPAQIVQNYAETGAAKCRAPAKRLLLLGVLAGLLICFGAVVSNTVCFSLQSASAGRIAGGLLFPFGLGMVVLSGAELFTGNCLIGISVLAGKVRVGAMLRNWALVYAGNFIGGLAVAASCAFFGQLELANGALAVHTIRVAAAKCALPFGSAVVLGICCNLLVCMGVVLSFAAKEPVGKALGAYLPVAYFVICGFEHCVANMYFVPAGIFAASRPAYAALAAAAGVDTAALSWGSFLLHNLLPVTLGNIAGGLLLGGMLWLCHSKWQQKATA